MALNREEKAAVIEEVSAQVAQAGSIVLAEYRGLTVEKITQLRKQARESGVYLRVLKNTLARRAVEGTPFAPLADRQPQFHDTQPAQRSGPSRLARKPQRRRLACLLY